mgnify:CR=1 FL=1
MNELYTKILDYVFSKSIFKLSFFLIYFSFTVYFNMFNLRYTILIFCFVVIYLFQKFISCESLSYKENEEIYQILIILMLISIELMTLNFNQFKWLRNFLSVMFDIKISSNIFVKIRYVEIILKTLIEYKSISIICSEIMNKNEYRHQLFEEYLSLVLLHISLTFFSFL